MAYNQKRINTIIKRDYHNRHNRYLNHPKLSNKGYMNQTHLLLTLKFKDTDLSFISKCCYNLNIIVDDVIRSITLDNSELYQA